MIQLQRKAYVLIKQVQIWNSFNAIFFFMLPRIKTTQKHNLGLLNIVLYVVTVQRNMLSG